MGDNDVAAISKLIEKIANELGSDAPASTSTPTKSAASSESSFGAADVPELRGALKQLRLKVGSMQQGARSALDRLAVGGRTKKALDSSGDDPSAYVHGKVQLLLSYLICLSQYLLLKSQGASVHDHPVMMRLLWIRTLLEKLRPIDQRLQYQMQKLLQFADEKKAENGAVSDPRALRPGELADTVDDEDSDGKDDHLGAEKDDGVYRPPMISQLEYTGDHVRAAEKEEKALERNKARLERSAFVQSLREEFTDAPAEINIDQRGNKSERAARKLSEKQAYEEDTMTRIRFSKAEAREQKKLLRESKGMSGGAVSLDELTVDFHQMQAAANSGGKGKGKRGSRSSGSVLQDFQNASSRARDARSVVNSALDGVMPSNIGGKRKGNASGGGGKRQRR